jgi:hypothetical protein
MPSKPVCPMVPQMDQTVATAIAAPVAKPTSRMAESLHCPMQHRAGWFGTGARHALMRG